MIKKSFLLSILFVGALVACSDEGEVIQTQEQAIAQKQAQAKKDSEPREVTLFREKLQEIARSGESYSESEKAMLLYPVAQKLIDVHGMPEDATVDPIFKTTEEQTAYLGFKKFIELVKNR